jgi:hypothetical protein
MRTKSSMRYPTVYIQELWIQWEILKENLYQGMGIILTSEFVNGQKDYLDTTRQEVEGMQMMVLEKEAKYFEAIRNELLGRARGEYALIHGEKLIGTFTSKEDAIKAGYLSFGNAPFLVKRIVDIEDTMHYTSHYLAFSSSG